MVMRKITGLIIEIDPIAIVENKVQEMKKKILEIEKQMGSLNGLNKQNERKIEDKKAQLKKQIDLLTEYNKKNKRAEARVAERQAVRLESAIERQIKRLEDSKKWYEILKSLKHAAELTVLDTENEVNDRKEEFESIKAQHKAFSSIMSIMKGDPDQMEDFTRAMDFMAYDITQKLGEMSNVIDETGGLLSQFAIEEGVASKKADELLQRYETNGIDGLFSAFNGAKEEKQAEPILVSQQFNTTNNGIKYFDFKY
jgi:chromosome segregation ATPase